MSSSENILKILNVFLDNHTDNLALADMVRLSGLHKLTVIRIVKTLVRYGYLAQPEKRGRYYLGPTLSLFSRIVSGKQQIRQIALPYLNKLAHLAREMVALAVLDNNEALIVEVVDSISVLKATLSVGTCLPLYSTGYGKVMLAFMDEARLEGYFNSVPLTPKTRKTITDPEAMRVELGRIRIEGVAYDFGEETEEIYNVAAPIKNASGEVLAAVGVIGPSIRLKKKQVKALAPYVKECAEAISRDLGNSEIIQKNKILRLKNRREAVKK